MAKGERPGFRFRGPSYSTKHHMKRRLLGTDWRFLGAVLLLVIAFVLALRYLG